MNNINMIKLEIIKAIIEAFEGKSEEDDAKVILEIIAGIIEKK